LVCSNDDSLQDPDKQTKQKQEQKQKKTEKWVDGKTIQRSINFAIHLEYDFDVNISRYRDMKLFEKVVICGHLTNKYTFPYHLNLRYL
jgi:hypothetical protein